jgi:16S rRNA (cytosine967-C5)-methyltransferase
MSESPNRHLSAHLRSAEQVLSHYPGGEPFPLYLRAFFRSNPKFGSRDRRVVSGLCYDSFRIGRTLADAPVRDRILAGHFLCAPDPAGLIALERPEWLTVIDDSLEDRLEFLASACTGFQPEDIFPLPEELSPDIDRKAFIRSHLIQPDLFIRLRPDRSVTMRQRIEYSGIPHRFIPPHGVALPNGTDTSSLGVADRDFVIQDLSSQITADFMPGPSQLPDRPRIWDACAGSGGKSILAHDRFANARLLVTDARESILANLKERFRTAGIRGYDVDRLDLTQNDKRKEGSTPSGFHLVVADVPCTGSGTWSRNPWEMQNVDLEVIGAYRSRQESILDRIMPSVGKGSYLLYITCSAYRSENEGMVEFMEANSGLRVLRQDVLKGYLEKADTMFAALFTSTA